MVKINSEDKDVALEDQSKESVKYGMQIQEKLLLLDIMINNKTIQVKIYQLLIKQKS